MPSTRVKKTPEERAESNRISCSKYYHNNKEIINQRPHRKEYNARFQRLTYNEEKKEHKRQYYIMTKNYRNLNFSKDIVRLFSIPLEVV